MGRENRPLNLGLLLTPSEQRIHRLLGVNVTLEDGRPMVHENKSPLFYASALLELGVEAVGAAHDWLRRGGRR